MSDINLKVMAEELGKDLEKAAPAVERELQAAIASLAQATYAGMIAKVQAMSMDPKNRQDYLRALKIEDLGEGSWMIYLDSESSSRLEEGFGSYSIKEKLLASEKTVKVGSRAGEPWVRKSKKGKKYAAVPFQHKPFSGEKSGDLAKDIKKIFVKNQAGKKQRITKIFKDLEGNPLTGAVARVGELPDQPNLSGLVKYQYVSPKGAVSSVYMTYRMVSEDSPGWQHPGHPGYGLFQEAQKYIEEELKNIVDSLL